MNSVADRKQALKEVILADVVRDKYDGSSYRPQSGQWIIDFRSILLHPKKLALCTEVIWDQLSDRDQLQIGGLESAAIPLVTSLVMKGDQLGKQVNGFYIRKSRKKKGLLQHIEGRLNADPIILVDDLMNSSQTFLRQLEVLEAAGVPVTDVFVIVRFRDLSFYEEITKRGITIHSIFTLAELGLEFGQAERYQIAPYTRKLLFPGKEAGFRQVCPRSVPAQDETALYFGTEHRTFYKIAKATGRPEWSITVGDNPKDKSIYSAPVLHEQTVFFGSYDGKLYALDTQTGSARWIFSGADWIGSSPAVAPELGLVFVGLEHALEGQRGSVVALDAETGEKRWEYPMTALTHASPLYIREHQAVCIGGNEGVLYLLDAETGELRWRFQTEGGMLYTGSGFSPGDIKLAPVYDPEFDQIFFTAMDGWLYTVQRSDGSLRFRSGCEPADTTFRIGIFARPVIYEDLVIYAGLDKKIYACRREDGAQVWTVQTRGRNFASPIIVGDRVFVGSNDGGLYEIEAKTGKLKSLTQFAERITTGCVKDTDQDILYVVTLSNQIYTLALRDI